ncbi:MAG: helix-turn-helix transcriptional regulator [Rhodospirillales bacterium]|nr:MAG: helix-turn-helix transcriptional regulator [Rhodospirillales bacterium]
MAEFLTTKDVAALLRIKERKVYELVHDNAIPVSRVTGKLLFPRDMVEAWVRRNVEFRGGTEGLVERPAVVAGSHDPLLDWALRESGSSLATFFDGSLSGLKRLAEGRAVAAGMHVYEAESEDWNRRHLAEAMPGMPVVLVEWAQRQQGLVLPPGNPGKVGSLADLVGRRLMPRQRAAGSRLLLDFLMQRDGIAGDAITLLDRPARSEADVALAVAEGKADAGLAVETVARQYRLEFLPLFRERYDLAVWRRDWFEPPLQRLVTFARTPAFAERAAELGGYDITGLGTVRYNAP